MTLARGIGATIAWEFLKDWSFPRLHMKGQLNLNARQLTGVSAMLKLRLLTLFAAAYMSSSTSAAAQTALSQVGVSRAQPTVPSSTHGELISPAAFTRRPHRSARSSLVVGAAIGAGSGAVLGALWGKYVDRQSQSCPNTGPCGGRSNVGPYALAGAAAGAVLGGALGLLSRNR